MCTLERSLQTCVQAFIEMHGCNYGYFSRNVQLETNVTMGVGIAIEYLLFVPYTVPTIYQIL